MNFFKHLFKVLTHKYYVMIYCFKAGLYFQGIVHDLSKFSPTEFFESVKYYQGTRSPINACKEDKGYSNAWLHHKGRNKHHHEYWQDDFDKGVTHLEMPFKYALEMVCDFLGANHAYCGKDFSFLTLLDWWENRKKVLTSMNPITLAFVDEIIKTLVAENNFNVLRKSRAKLIYERIKDEKECLAMLSNISEK